MHVSDGNFILKSKFEKKLLQFVIFWKNFFFWSDSEFKLSQRVGIWNKFFKTWEAYRKLLIFEGEVSPKSTI